ncbi:MAG: alpha/beta hydrolase [Lachnospiraceae bacterium]|nr:alpha/beta hydrolase [Lachnospiraceae bacterium]
MNSSPQKGNKKRLAIAISIVSFLLAVFIAGAIYLNDYYHADTEAIESFTGDYTIEKKQTKDGIVYAPDEATKGLIFYPGGKVEYTAYIPLMEVLASEGIVCVLVEMPFNLAVLDMNAADGIQEQYPQVEQWYIGGHSLGGAMAATYLADHVNLYEGLILLGAYSTEDLSKEKVRVLSIYGSEDKVMNHKKYRDNKDNLPEDFCEIIIEGGCHAYFGMYGKQEGDGTPQITNEEQIHQTADNIIEFME